MNCKQISELSTWSQITIWGDTGAVCTKEGDDTLKCTTSLASLTPWNGTITIKQWTTTIWWFNLNDSESKTLTLATWGNSGSSYTLPAATSTTLWGVKLGSETEQTTAANSVTSTAWKTYAVQVNSNGQMVVNVPREPWNGWSWDSLWKTGIINMGTRTPSVLTPKDTSNGLYLKQSVYYDSSLEFWWLSNYGSNRTRQLKLDPAWIRIGESTSTYGYTWVGIWVLGAVWIWTFSNCDSNHLTMFASWNTETWNFEILWNSRLLVGVKNDSYIFFNLGNTVGINTTGTAGSTLNVKWSVKVGNCGKQSWFWSNRHAVRDSSTVWQIRYVDTTNPWQFVWCIKSGTDYYRVSLSYGNNTVSNFTNSSDCTPAIPYNSDIYSQIWINLYQQCSS